jgi:WD40 repeat protein
MKGPSGQVRCVAITPDGRRALSGGDDRTIQFWDLETGKVLQTLRGHSDRINGVAMTPDGLLGMTGSSDGIAKFWDLDRGVVVQTLGQHSDRVDSVAITPDGRRGLTGSRDGTAKLWDLQTGKVLRTLRGQSDWIKCVAMTSDGSRGLTIGQSKAGKIADRDKKAELWDLENGVILKTLAGHASQVVSVAFTPDGQSCATGSWDGTMKLWDVKTGESLQTLRGHSNQVWSLALSADGRRALTGNWSGTVDLWDLEAGALLRTLKGHNGTVTSAAISSDGRRGLTGSDMGSDGTAKLWDLETGALTRTLLEHTGPVSSVALTANGRRALTGSWDGTARLWDLDKFVVLQTLRHSDHVDSVAMTPRGHRGLTGSRDGTAKLWDLETGRLLQTFEGESRHVTAVAINSDGNLCLIGSHDQTAKLWNLEKIEPLQTLKGEAGGWVGFSAVMTPDGRRGLTGSLDGTAKLWDLKTGKALHTLRGHLNAVSSVVITADGRRGLTSSWDSTTCVWDLDTGRELCRFLSFGDNTWAVADRTGRYDASDAGSVHGLHWVVGLEPINLSQLKERYYDPRLLAKRMGLSTEPLRSVEGIGALRLHPDLELAAPATDDARGTLGITLTDRGGGIGKVVVKINGKVVAAAARGERPDIDPRPEVMRLAVPLAGDPRLIPGTANRVEVLAYNADGSLRSRGAVVEYLAGGPAERPVPELWAVVVGTADYIGTEIDLRYAAKDAEAFSQALAVAADRLLEKEHVHIQTLSTDRPGAGDRPTRANIEAAFKQIVARARPTDLLVVYLSGHGVAPQGSDEYYYLTADARSLELGDPEVRRRDALSGAELAEMIRAVPAVGKQVLILDTCAAGQGIKALGQRRAVSGDQVRALERVKDRNGLHLLAGAAADASSYEASRYGQGLLTYSLLLGMTGPGLKGTELDVLTWFGYAVDEVPELARGIGGVQKPQLSSPREGASFPLGRLEAEDRVKIPLPKERPLVLRASLVDKSRFVDSLGLGGRVDELMREASARGDVSQPVFVDAREGEGAYQLGGAYQIEGESVSVEFSIYKANETVHQVTVRGLKAHLDELTKAIVAEVDKRLKP